MLSLPSKETANYRNMFKVMSWLTLFPQVNSVRTGNVLDLFRGPFLLRCEFSRFYFYKALNQMDLNLEIQYKIPIQVILLGWSTLGPGTPISQS